MDSKTYWIERYKNGGNSGAGSYGHLAKFKADFLNEFVKDNNIQSVSEFGCGDGNQLALYNFPFYTGYDVSAEAVNKCCEMFPDPDKCFLPVDWPFIYDADLAISIDVIYHLIEDDVFEKHMNELFTTATRFVIIYSTNNPGIPNTAKHVKHRRFTDWVNENAKDFTLTRVKKNEYPYTGDTHTGSSCDFFVFEKLTN